MICTNCGNEFEGNFCSNCGTPVNKESLIQKEDSTTNIEPEIKPKTTRKKICKVCGQKVDSDICSNCGTPVTKVSRRKTNPIHIIDSAKSPEVLTPIINPSSNISQVYLFQQRQRLTPIINPSSNISYDVLLVSLNFLCDMKFYNSINRIIVDNIAVFNCMRNIPQIIGHDLTSKNADILISTLNKDGAICEKHLSNTNTNKSNDKTMINPIINSDFIEGKLISRKLTSIENNTNLKKSENVPPIVLIIILIIFIVLMCQSCDNNTTSTKPTPSPTSTASKNEYTPQPTPSSSDNSNSALSSSEKTHQAQERLASTVNYKIVERLVNDSPLKTQVEIRLVVIGEYSSDGLLSLLKILYDDEIAQSGYQYRDNPNSIYIWAYTSSIKAKDGSPCIAMLQKSTEDPEPYLSIDK